MKIALIIPSLENKGPIIFTKYLIDSIKSKVDCIDVYYFSSRTDVVDLGVPCLKIRFFDQFNYEKYDVIHSTMLVPDLYMYYHRKKVKAKVVISLHNLYADDLRMLYAPWKYWILKCLWEMALNRNVPLIVSSSEMMRYYKNNLKSRNEINIIPYGINYKAFTDIPKEDYELLSSLKSKYKIIGSVGVLIKRKGFNQLIDFLENNKDYAVVIIGDGIERLELNNYARKKQVSDRFHLIGFRNNSYNYYKFIDAFAMVSYSEGFGLAMLEAMSHSIPIVCSNLPIYKDYFTEEDVCLFEPNNRKSLSDAINNAINKIDTYKQKAFNLYEKNFSLEVMGNRHIKLYRRLIDPKL